MKTISYVILLGLLTAPFTSASFAADATHNWTQHCIRCHGEDGRGATKMGRKFRIKDLTLEKTQRRLSDEEITELIATGYKDNAGEERMPAFREKLSEEELKELLRLIRGFKVESR